MTTAMTSRQETQQLAIAHYRAAAALFDTDRPAAFLRLQQALELFDQTGDTVCSAAALSGMAEVLFLDGEYERALESWEHALRLDSTLDIQALTVTLDKMACSCARLNRWPRALELWRQALDIDRQVGNVRNQV